MRPRCGHAAELAFRGGPPTRHLARDIGPRLAGVHAPGRNAGTPGLDGEMVSNAGPRYVKDPEERAD